MVGIIHIKKLPITAKILDGLYGTIQKNIL
jgi:hypothetical protein